ncbi:C-type lectin 37Db-like [Drosophila novamexicana]|uniref:C-type lectin 37Db-like n=1 Tax=Drosophila novamexicana TaxID=47314 RepID=UPI0011E5E499|nr:C-type lectin 37Db-like [Drosophila novamexicana]
MKVIFIFLLISIPARQVSCEDSKELLQYKTRSVDKCLRAGAVLIERMIKMQTDFNELQSSQNTNAQDKMANITALINDKFDGIDKRFNFKNLPKTPFEKIGAKYYYIEVETRANWFEAAHKCRQLGGHLINLKNDREYDNISKHLVNSNLTASEANSFWLDMNDLSVEDQFLSLTTGLNVTFAHWEANQPDDFDNEDCVELRNKQNRFVMNDASCETKKYFICQKE